MTYYLLENLGLSMVLIVILYGLSWILLQMKRFQIHIAYLVLLGVLTVGLALWENPYLSGSQTVFVLVVCAWDQYWTKANLSQQPLALEEAKKRQKNLAIILTIVAILVVLRVPILVHLDKDVAVAAAALLWVEGYVRRDNGKGRPFYQKSEEP
jgi:hypothetical protein